jgi:hypothetical protein
VKTAFGAITCRAGVAGWACSEERATSVRIKTSSQPIIILTIGQSPRAERGEHPKTRARVVNVPTAAAISPAVELRLRSQLRQRVRKARPFEQIAKCAVGGALRFIYQATPLSLNLHVNATTSGVDIKACLCGGKADYHTGMICHEGASFPFGNSHTAGAPGTDIIMTVEILKML